MAIRDGRDHPATARALAPPGLGLPARPTVPRIPQACVGAEREEAPEIRVLPYNVRRDVRRQAFADVGPRLAVVGGLERVRVTVVELVAIDGEIRGAPVERRDPDLVDASLHVLREPGEVARHVGPRFPGVPCHVHEAVVTAGPDHARIRRGEVHRENRAVRLRARDVVLDRAATRHLLGHLVASYVGTARGPALTALRAYRDQFTDLLHRVA